MNRQYALMAAGIALALLAVAPSAQAMRMTLPPEVVAVLEGLPNPGVPTVVPPPPPNTPACINPSNGVVTIGIDCLNYALGPVLDWATTDVVTWVQAYGSQLAGYPVRLGPYNGQLNTWAAAAPGAAVGYAASLPGPVVTFGNQVLTSATDAATQAASGTVSYATNYESTVQGWTPGATATVTGDAVAASGWTTCHVFGQGCPLLPPAPATPGMAPVPGVPPAPVVPSIPPTPSVLLPSVPMPPLPPPVPTPSNPPPPPSH